jgi:hypothetical protein
LTVEEEEEEEEEEAIWGREKKAKQSKNKAKKKQTKRKRASKSLQLQHSTHQTPHPPFRRFARDVNPPTTHLKSSPNKSSGPSIRI